MIMIIATINLWLLKLTPFTHQANHLKIGRFSSLSGKAACSS